jgi:ubiquitin carboxyl-terminal hydrolase L3
MSSNASVSAPRYRKHFIPLESNPEVFTELVHKLGVSRTLCFQDVLSLDDSELLAMVPRPAYALVLVFPTTEAYENRIKDEESLLEANGGAEGDVLFFKQTINNACGLYALLHAVCNGEARGKLGICELSASTRLH